MTTQDYLKALDALGLSPASKRTAQALGVGLTTIQKYASGARTIPGPVVRLLAMYRKHHLPKEYRA
jgi:hypothetical protein